MDIKSKILSIITPVIESKNLLLIDLIVRGDERKRIIEIFVDSSENISAESLAELSREINNLLQTEESFLGNYRLDVSSPGVERPLKYLAQYPKHINRMFEISYKSDNEVKNMKAKLVRVNGEELLYNDGKNEILINFNQIIKAKVLISFS
jgi:ribosome maturation factor RimP